MSRNQRNLTIVLWALTVVAMLSLVASGMLNHARNDAPRMQASTKGPVPENGAQLPRLFELPDFSLVDQNGGRVELADLKGHVWIADFIFTRCAGICLNMSGHMGRLQPVFGPAGVRLVSFSVDPAFDTPEILKGYGANHGADEKVWSLLSGDEKAIYHIADTMKLSTEPANSERPIIHSPMFVLIGRQGWVRGYYDSNDPERMERLKADALKLAAE